MKNARHHLLLLALLLGTTILLPGCAVDDVTDENGLTAREAEEAGSPPVPGAKWRKGHYVTRGTKNLYVPGQWVYPGSL